MGDRDMERRIVDAMRNTWQAIGADVLRAVADLGHGEDDLPVTDVIDVVMDAGHMEAYGDDPEAVYAFRAMDDLGRARVSLEAFPYERYGM